MKNAKMREKRFIFVVESLYDKYKAEEEVLSMK